MGPKIISFSQEQIHGEQGPCVPLCGSGPVWNEIHSSQHTHRPFCCCEKNVNGLIETTLYFNQSEK